MENQFCTTIKREEVDFKDFNDFLVVSTADYRRLKVVIFLSVGEMKMVG